MILKPNQRENILPLPVVLISTVSKDVLRNAAPWSNFTPVLRPLEEVVLASWIKRDTLEKALSKLDGVLSAKVDLRRKVACIDYDPAKLKVEDFKRAVQTAGYKVE
jgi:copper chaperone CopZ